MPIAVIIIAILIVLAVYILSNTDKNSGSEIAHATTTDVTTTVSTSQTTKAITSTTTTASKVTSKTTAKTTAVTTSNTTTATTTITTTTAVTTTATAATVTTVTTAVSSDGISLKSGYENGIVVSVGQTINVLAYLNVPSDVRGFDFSVQSDGEYIKMLASGELTAVAPGTAYVTISPKDNESECTLKVTVRG